MNNWFVLRTITGKEKKVKEIIERTMLTDTKLVLILPIKPYN